ncbi:DUF3500 domain-containing protein [Thalassospira marina]|uniref:DUF3500 domain-containing protein n=1 Tax=Thalassospira marina TaxID=2048283 RepID=A0A2N3KSX0_9PROT|nr:DUF3500 domain-containing protein [Thalassospira marina]PKR53635.1 hypothetical protein COO20_13985 [Thalassospira marina]
MPSAPNSQSPAISSTFVNAHKRLRYPARFGAFIGGTLFLLGCAPGIAATAERDETNAETTNAFIASNDTQKAYRAVLAHARAFAKSLSDGQRNDLMQAYNYENAARWHTYPQWYLNRPWNVFDRPRIGLRLETLSDDQWQALNALLKAATGTGRNEGFDEIQQHLNADDHLHDAGKGDAYGRGDFYIAFLGEPSETGLWQLQFGGHHFALSNTYHNGILTGATPSFRGIEPNRPFTYHNIENAPQQQEMDAFKALLASLDGRQRKDARLNDHFGDVMLRYGKDWDFPKQAKGIPATTLDTRQRALLLAVIAGYVDDINDANADLIMAHYESQLDDTYVAYSGDISLSQTGDYVRIDGPSVWIELYMDSPFNFDIAHPHSVWRDKYRDYGGLHP